MRRRSRGIHSISAKERCGQLDIQDVAEDPRPDLAFPRLLQLRGGHPEREEVPAQASRSEPRATEEVHHHPQERGAKGERQKRSRICPPRLRLLQVRNRILPVRRGQQAEKAL